MGDKIDLRLDWNEAMAVFTALEDKFDALTASRVKRLRYATEADTITSEMRQVWELQKKLSQFVGCGDMPTFDVYEQMENGEG